MRNELSDLTVKFIYTAMKCDAHITSPGVRKWKQTFPTVDVDQIWPKVFDSFSENRKNELQWLIVHRAIKIAVKLCDWKVISSPACNFCGATETLEHLFFVLPSESNHLVLGIQHNV